MSPEKYRERLHQHLVWILTPLARLLTRLGILPNHVTIAGPVVNLAVAGLIMADSLVLAGVLYLVAATLDLLDGIMARLQDRMTALGAFLDSTLDRISEGVVFAAIAIHFAALGQPENVGLVVLALLGSLLISYTRARAEALGARCKVGVVTRAERVLLLAFGLGFGVLEAVIYVFVALTAFTVAQRIRHTQRELSPGN